MYREVQVSVSRERGPNQAVSPHTLALAGLMYPKEYECSSDGELKVFINVRPRPGSEFRVYDPIVRGFPQSDGRPAGTSWKLMSFKRRRRL